MTSRRPPAGNYASDLVGNPRRFEKHIERLKKAGHPRHYLVYDAESDLEQITPDAAAHRVKLIVSCPLTLYPDGSHDEGAYRLHTDKEDWWRTVTDYLAAHGHIFLVAHNSNYDSVVTGFYDLMDKEGFECRVFNPRFGSFFVEFFNGPQTITHIDSLNWFGGSLKNLGREIGIKKGEMPESGGVDDHWVEYCKQDVRIVVESMKKLSEFLSKYGVGELGITRAALSMRIYRLRFKRGSLYTITDLDRLKMEYSAYHGGRVECFWLGNLPAAKYYTLDVNSMYPAMMAWHRFSTKYRTSYSNVSVDRLRTLSKMYGLVAKVEVNTSAPYLPFKSDDGLLFPTGRFVTYLTTPEIAEALARGHITRCHKVQCYLRTDLFSDYIRHFYRLKRKYDRERNGTYRLFTKIFMNSLYGKFGQKVNTIRDLGMRDKVRYNIVGHTNLATGTMSQIKTINYKMYEEIQNVIGVYSLPVVAAEVTAHARIYMWKLIERVGLDHVYYTDTDSLIVSDTGRRKIPKRLIGGALGQLKVEDRYEDLTIYGPKDYTAGKKRALKGVPKTAVQEGDDIYEFDRFSSVISYLKEPDVGTVTTTRTRKVLTREYSKGVVTESGRVVPYHFG